MTNTPAPNDPRPTLTEDAHADLCTRLEILIAEYASAGDRVTATAKLHAILSRVNPASLGGVPILSSSVGSPTLIATNGPHGLTSGEKVCLTEHVGAAPALSGEYLVTVIDASHYSIPVNVTTAGAGGLSTPVARTAAPRGPDASALPADRGVPASDAPLRDVDRADALERDRLARAQGSSWPASPAPGFERTQDQPLTPVEPAPGFERTQDQPLTPVDKSKL